MNCIFPSFQVPTTEEEWDDTTKEFEEKLDVCSAIGVEDGKHNFVRCPQLIGSCHTIIYLKTG